MSHEFITLPKNAKDVTSQRFGRFVVLGPISRTDKYGIVWLCQCDCGNVRKIPCGRLRSGNTKSCGCLQKDISTTHGLHNGILYGVWAHIIQRCTNPKCHSYPNYGGRGITVCDEWRYDFKAFHDYVSRLPHYNEEGYTLDRADNSLGYFPDNLRFATTTEQNRNQRRNVMIEHNGKIQCLTAWAVELGISSSTLQWRFRHGWSADRALTTLVT